MFKKLLSSPLFPILMLLVIILGLYYKLFILGKIPFPGDLMVTTYSPWFDSYKFPVQNPLISDVFSQLFLWKYLSIDAFKNFQWPLWNPYSFSGTPLLANFQSSPLYPLNILLIFPSYFGWGLFIFSQTLIAAFSMYILLSQWVSSISARISGAILFSLGGLMSTWVELGTSVHAIAWLPLSLYAIDKFYETLKVKYILLLSLTFSLTVLAGSHQILIFNFLTIILYSIIREKISFSYQFFTKISFIGLGLLTAVLITAPQTFPTLELISKSIRQTEEYSTENQYGLLPLQESMKFFIADFFGNPVTRNYRGFLNYFETSNFLGTLVFPLIIFSLFLLRKQKVVLISWIFLFIYLILTFQNPLSFYLYQLKLPLLTSSYASRSLFLINFFAAILLAFSINEISKNASSFKKIFSIYFLFSLFIGATFIYLNLLKSNPSQLGEFLYLSSSDSQINLMVTIRNMFLPLIILGIIISFFILIFFTSRVNSLQGLNKLLIKSLPVFIAILLIFDLGRYFLKFNPFVSQEYIFPTPPVLEYLQTRPGTFRIGRDKGPILTPNTWTHYNLQTFEGYDPLYLNSYGRYINYLNNKNFSASTNRYGGYNGSLKSPFIDSLNIKYIIAPLYTKIAEFKGDQLSGEMKETNYPVVFQDKSTVILENPSALERVYFAKSIIKFSSQEKAEEYMTTKVFDPKTQAVIYTDISLDAVNGEGNVEISTYSDNEVVIKTSTEQKEFLILADQYEEGWQVKINGKLAAIIPVNSIFRGVEIPEGENQVKFSYLPQSFIYGLYLSLITLSLILISLVISKGTILNFKITNDQVK